MHCCTPSRPSYNNAASAATHTADLPGRGSQTRPHTRYYPPRRTAEHPQPQCTSAACQYCSSSTHTAAVRAHSTPQQPSTTPPRPAHSSGTPSRPDISTPLVRTHSPLASRTGCLCTAQHSRNTGPHIGSTPGHNTPHSECTSVRADTPHYSAHTNYSQTPCIARLDTPLPADNTASHT